MIFKLFLFVSLVVANAKDIYEKAVEETKDLEGTSYVQRANNPEVKCAKWECEKIGTIGFYCKTSGNDDTDGGFAIVMREKSKMYPADVYQGNSEGEFFYDITIDNEQGVTKYTLILPKRRVKCLTKNPIPTEEEIKVMEKLCAGDDMKTVNNTNCWN